MDRRTGLSGAEHTIAAGPMRAAVVEVGASLRSLEVGRRPLVRPWADDSLRPSYSGAVLAPWPNRLRDGSYRWDGTTYRLPVDEAETSTALHGLVAWERWEVLERTADTVTLGHRLVPRPGYPFPLSLRVRYAVSSRGLSVTLTARNDGTAAAPYGAGLHPYLVAGDGSVDDWQLRVPAGSVLRTDDRGLPVGLRPLGELDFRRLRRMGPTMIDHAFTDLVADADSRCRVEVRGPDGRGVAASFDRSCRWLQLYTGDLPEIGRTGLAVEPMTCPPDALGSGQDLVRLEPGDRHSLTVWIEPLDEADGAPSTR